MKPCCDNPRPDLAEASCGCKDEICFQCGNVTIISVCDECHKLHFG